MDRRRQSGSGRDTGRDGADEEERRLEVPDGAVRRDAAVLPRRRGEGGEEDDRVDDRDDPSRERGLGGESRHAPAERCDDPDEDHQRTEVDHSVFAIIADVLLPAGAALLQKRPEPLLAFVARAALGDPARGLGTVGPLLDQALRPADGLGTG